MNASIMRIDLDQIAAHAGARLRDVPDGVDRLTPFRRLLELEMERLRKRHRMGLGGREITRARSYLVDLVVRRACQLAADALGPAARTELEGCAVLAVGGYGREELAPGSDVDLLVLRPTAASSVLEAFVETLLPTLWDVGLELGHSYRSIDECVAIGREDLHARNAMSDARLVAGAAALYTRFSERMDEAIYRSPRDRRALIGQVLAEQQDRLARYGDTVCVQEPNTKESAGGLRDIHVVGWIARLLLDCHAIERLHSDGHVSAAEQSAMQRAYSFISRARNEAHFRTGRSTDTLSLELQPEVAEALGYEAQGRIAASERFMRDYYRAGLELRRFNERFLLRTGALEPPRPLLPLPRRTRATGPGGRFVVRHGELFPIAGRDPSGPDGHAMLDAFETAQEERVTLSDRLAHDIRASLHRVDRRFQTSDDAARRFLAMLDRPCRAAAALRAMHETGFLAAYIPPFRRISLLVQHDRYHRYTVDEHTLRAVDALDTLQNLRALQDLAGGRATSAGADAPVTPHGELLDALAEIRDPRRLVLAVLLHDIGKGRGGSHATRGARIARGVCARLGLGPDTTADVEFLVHKHLVMSRVSQRRDLSDPTLLEGFADTVETLDRLNMLFLLTYADITAVAPGAWNDWKAALLSKLYARTRPLVSSGRDDAPSQEPHRRLEERVVDHLLPEYLRGDLEAFLARLPERYVRAVTADQIAGHFRMARTLGSRAVQTDWHDDATGRHTLLSTCAPDTPGLLARLAGTLTGADLDILSVDAFTTDDGLALDVFTVVEADGGPVADPDRRHRIHVAMESTVEGRLDVADAVAHRWARLPWRRTRRQPAPPQVDVGAPDALGRTPIEVRADDQPGLVYRISDRLSRIGLVISFAKIATEKSRALDIFYVTRPDASPLADDDVDRVRSALLAALTEGWPPTSR